MAAKASRGARLEVLRSLEQSHVVAGLLVVLCAVFALTLDGFASPSNLVDTIQSIAPLGVLGLGMAIVIIGGGLDLSLIVVSLVATGVTLTLAGDGVAPPVAVFAGLGLAFGIGLLNGYLVAYVEIPPLFATIGTSLLVFGVARLTFFSDVTLPMPREAQPIFDALSGRALGIPVSVVVLVGLAVVVHLALTRTVPGRFLYAKGDNPAAARLTGIPVRLMTVFTFASASLLGAVAGLLIVRQGRGLNSSLAFSSLLYDVIAIAVIGGISLAGGRGKVSGVIFGALLVGVLLNAMTLMNLTVEQQTIVKGGVLLAAIVVDALLHPRALEQFKAGDL